MIMSATIGKLAEALAKAQSELECAKKDHNPLMSYSKDKSQEMTNLAEFLSNELEYSPEFIYDLLNKFAKQQKSFVLEDRKVMNG